VVLPFFIARRYLFAKKSHNVINIISAISSIGMAVGTAALVLILSVYNGFNKIVKDNLGTLEPDILITPVTGKVFRADSLPPFSDPSYASVSRILEDNVYVRVGDYSAVAKARGVDSTYEASSPIAGSMWEGEFSLHAGDVPMASFGRGLAYRMGITSGMHSPVELYYPYRNRRFSVSNPGASLSKVKVYPGGTFAVNADVDNNLLFLPMETMRQLLEYGEGEVSAVEIRLKDPSQAGEKIKDLQKTLGPSFKVADRFAQNESIYKMMKYEKAAIFLILIFVIIIIAFNIFGSLSMLVIEKKEDIGTLRSLGATSSLIRRIFVLEGWMISLVGMIAGLVIGVLLVFLQQRLGIVKMPVSFGGMSAYPVILQWTDVLFSALGVALIGYVIALLPTAGKQL